MKNELQEMIKEMSNKELVDHLVKLGKNSVKAALAVLICDEIYERRSKKRVK